MNISKNIFFIVLLVAFSCSKPADQIHKNVSKINHSLPVISIVVDSLIFFDDSTGIYRKGIGLGTNWQGEKANYFSGKKIPMDMAYFINKYEVINQNGKLKISGGGSRKQPQKSFNISSKEGFNFSFFKNLPFNNYKTLRLRVSGQDWRKTMLRDALMHTLVSETNIDVQAYQPVILYLNGSYWGIYNMREKFNKYYLKQHHLINKVDILENNSQLIEGCIDEYNELSMFAKHNDLTKYENWNWIKKRVDLDNFIDYYCAQIYFANTDWPGNNIKYWKAKNGKWRWFLHDTDLGFAFAPAWGHPGGLEHNTLKFALNDSTTTHHNQAWSTLLFRKFLDNDEFRENFLYSFKKHLDKTFNSERVITIIDSLKNNIEKEIPKHIDRWKNEAEYALQSKEEWSQELEVLKQFAVKRPEIVRDHLKQQFDK